jgi:7,8-dihydropterin-6-yl-methyl-4-(beta-D-ribofuranosyl)aminobenzene 5'-phosphate synthase
MAELALTLLSENNAVPPFEPEHGLSIFLQYHEKQFLFDTGSSKRFLENAEKMGIDLTTAEGVILSHGHYDHTGGLQELAPQKIWYAPGISKVRYSRHPGKPVKELTMPPDGQKILKQYQASEIKTFTEISPGVFLTGPIPRESGEDCGGPFFLDPEGNEKDLITEEQALLLKEGILIQGCCHAGIINSMEYCRKQRPDIKIHTIIGGLHLLLANDQRILQTAEYLRNAEIKTLFLLHCTGQNAIELLKKELPETKILTPGVDGIPLQITQENVV